MFHHGQQFHMGKTHIVAVCREYVCKLTPTQPSVAFLRYAPPRAGVEFINRNRTIAQGALRPRLHPCSITPVEPQIPYHGRSTRRTLLPNRKRVSFLRRKSAIR